MSVLCGYNLAIPSHNLCVTERYRFIHRHILSGTNVLEGRQGSLILDSDCKANAYFQRKGLVYDS